MFRTLSLACAALTLVVGAAIADCKVQKVADLPVTMAGYPLVDAKVNGTALHFIADSGAFFSLISPAVAAQLHLNTVPAPFGFYVEGIGGASNAEVGVAKDFEIAGAKLHRIQFLITGNGLGPEVAGALGQNLLGYADVEYDLANGIIRLWRPVGCGERVLAYWLAKDQGLGQLDIRPLSEVHHTVGEATINGHRIRATFDTGSPRSYVVESAARRAGIDVTAPSKVEGYREAGGIGLKTFPTFIAPVQSFSVGGEEIHNTRLRVGEADLEDIDMLIGADFFLSHRVYVSNAQHRMYFTYNGGPVFDLSVRPKSDTGANSPSPAAVAVSDTDPSALARHGNASAARGDFQAAIDYLTRARVAAPADAEYAFDLAKAYLQKGQMALAMANVNDAIRLQPDRILALMLRAELLISKGQRMQAIADIDSAARLAPKSTDSPMALAQLYISADAPLLAIAQYDLWLNGHPEDVGRTAALNGRCWARATLGQDLTKALADCNAALRRGGRLQQVLDSRGLVRLRLGQFDQAIADYDAALAINPKVAWSLYGRGIAKLRLGQTAQGKADIAAATALSSTLPQTAKGYGIAP